MKKLSSLMISGVRGGLTTASVVLLIVIGSGALTSAQAGWQTEWEQVLAAAKKEGKVVLAIPPSTKLRKQLESVFQKRFGIKPELVLGRGSKAAARIASETKAGVHYFDVMFGSYSTVSRSLLPMGALEPAESQWILPEVKDPKNWWGGHIWGDNTKRYVYYPTGFTTDTLWYNTELVKPGEITSYDDLLDPKWKGKIGWSDPRTSGAGLAVWSFLWMTKGEDYLKKLVKQDLLLAPKKRILADALAKGKIAITSGVTYYSFLPFIEAGIPIKPISNLKEGRYGSIGNGAHTILKNRPHPNATKVFVNWMLSKEGQEVYVKAFGQGSRRHDVDTSWTPKVGYYAAKDTLTAKEFSKVELSTQDKIINVRRPAKKFSRKILP